MPALALMAAVAIVMGSILALYAGRGENMEDVGQQRLAGLGLVVVGLLLAWLSWAASPVKQALREHRWRQKPI